MIKIEDTMSIVGQLLRNRISDLSSIIPHDSPCNDAISSQVNHIDKIYYRVPPEYTPYRYIHSRLGHITVNPQDDDTTDALVNIYVTLHDSGKDVTFVNHSPESIDDFVEELIDLAEEERSYSHRHDARVIVLHGPRGCGKTFFLNHILAKNSSYFDEHSILWIRVNLTANFGGSTNLRHWIYAQCAKVILRYYDEESDYYKNPKSVPIPLKRHLTDFIETSQHNINVRNRQLVSLQQMCQVFHKRNRDEPISPSLIPLILGRESFYFALEQGYKIIVALDGLDQLESTIKHRQRFADLYLQAIELAHSYDPFKAALLVVTRTNTLNTIPESREAYSFTRITDEYKQLHTVSLENIIQLRKSYIKNRVEALQKIKGWESSNYSDHIDDFFGFLQTEESDVSRTYVISSFGDNRRAQMQSIQLAYFDFLRQAKDHPYHLVESLVKAGRYFPPRHYYYELDRDTYVRNIGNNSLFDSHLLPSIFAFPCIYHGLVNVPHIKESRPYEILLALRILQFVCAHESRIKDERNPATKLTVAELVEVFTSYFNYSRELVMLVIEELEQFEFINLSSRDFPVPTYVSSLEVNMTKKPLFLLNYLVYEIAYLNLAYMRVPIASNYLTGNMPYFRAYTLNYLDMPPPYGPNTPNERRTILLRWILAKITNSIALCRLLVTLNEHQKEETKRNVTRLRPRLAKTLQVAQRAIGDREAGMFGFASLTITELERQIQNIISSLDEKERQWIHEQINIYKKAWE